jgi:hypothetical protein
VLVPVPAAVVIEIGPVFAPDGTAAAIWWSETTLNVVAAVEPNVTVVAPVKFAPLIVTVVPTGPLVGVNPLTVGGEAGGAVTENAVEVVAVPPEVVTEIGPLVAPLGTVAVICVSLATLYAAAWVPLNLTLDAPVNPPPVIVTLVPGGPDPGLKPLIDGAVTVELPQPGSVNDPMRVSQSSSAFVVGCAS